MRVSEPKRSFYFNLKNLPANTKLFLLVYLLSMIASSIPAVLVIFFVRDLLGVESYTGLFFIIVFPIRCSFHPFLEKN